VEDEETRMTANAPVPEIRPQAVGPTSASPLNESHLAQIDDARRVFKVIRRAQWTALSSSVTTLIIGVVAVPFLIFWPSVASALITVGLLVVGVVEYLGYCKLRQADPAAATLLSRNQLAFLGLIILYCAIQMLTFSTDEIKATVISPEFRAELTNAMPEMNRTIDGYIDDWGPLAVRGFYGLVIVLSLVFQGGLSFYYYKRRKALLAFQAQPAWVRSVLLERRTPYATPAPAAPRKP
jgi:hypothetical protein